MEKFVNSGSAAVMKDLLGFARLGGVRMVSCGVCMVLCEVAQRGNKWSCHTRHGEDKGVAINGNSLQLR